MMVIRVGRVGSGLCWSVWLQCIGGRPPKSAPNNFFDDKEACDKTMQLIFDSFVWTLLRECKMASHSAVCIDHSQPKRTIRDFIVASHWRTEWNNFPKWIVKECTEAEELLIWHEPWYLYWSRLSSVAVLPRVDTLVAAVWRWLVRSGLTAAKVLHRLRAYTS